MLNVGTGKNHCPISETGNIVWRSEKHEKGNYSRVFFSDLIRHHNFILQLQLVKDPLL